MSSSFSTVSASILKMLSEIYALPQPPLTVGIEFTETREDSSDISLKIGIQCLLAETPGEINLKEPQKGLKKVKRPEVYKP